MFEIFYVFNLIIDGINSIFSTHIISGLSTIMFVVALVAMTIEGHRMKKDAGRIEQMDEGRKKTYYLISLVRILIPIAIAILLKIYYFYDRIFIKGDLSAKKDVVSLVLTVAIFIIVMILFRKKPKLKKKVIRKIKNFFGKQ